MTPQEDPIVIDELTSLKARADLMGITYHPSIKIDKLREKVNAAVEPEEAPEVEAPTLSEKQAKAKKHAEMIADAGKLVRVRVVCMNPNKKDWTGEIYTISNAVVGTHKKFVPFNIDEGWHIPNIIYQNLRDRECQVFVTTKDSRGNSVRRGKLIKEFAIEVLPPLSPAELQDLAQRQAISHAID